MKITSVNNKTIKEVTKLHQKKYRDQAKQFICEGYHLYEEAKAHGIVKHIYTTDETIKGQNVTYVSKHVLEKLANTKRPQGVVTVCKMLENTNLSDKVLLCDHVQDPGNLGTLIRSALAFGFETIVLEESVDIYNDKVLRSTQGAFFQMNIITQNILEFINSHSDYYYIGTALSNQQLTDITHSEKVGIIVGNEGSGISKEILEKTNINVTIPIQKIDSLNVGVAGSIVMHFISDFT
ncbi:MAG: RNA methyltransferase [Candidatus Izemoplasma sp.]|nr:RNA methyltransferase [Candidatus Izemoplasma sp.]